ncbi:MAG TPA: EthD family reductase [Dehalococcoidia bacterium]|nr:EthD family reductase [Dehalococcoidia bacterium]
MYKLISVVWKRPGLSPDEFWDLWSGEHAAQVLAQPRVKHYRINAALARSGREPAFDGVAEIWVETLDDLRALQMARLAGPLAESRARVTDAARTLTLVTRERVVVPEPAPGTAAVKLCEVLRRRPDLSFEEFDRHWIEVHAPLVTRVKGLVGYVQHPAIPGSDPPPSADGHVMLWFDTLENARLSARSAEGEATIADAAEFLAGAGVERVAVRERRFR